MDIQLFDNYEDDGQLSLFRYDDSEIDMEYKPEAEKPVAKKAEAEGTADVHAAPGGLSVRIKRCSSCGKLLFVREEAGGYAASCNNCGIDYFQKV